MTPNLPIIEDNVRIDSAPVVLIEDRLLKNCTPAEIQRAILSLVNRIQDQRATIKELERRINAAT